MYELPDIENRLKNNYSRSARHQVAFDSEKQLLDSIEKQRTKCRITGYLYRKDH